MPEHAARSPNKPLGDYVNQPLKLLYLVRIFEQKTDQDHGLTIGQIIELLEKEHVRAERKMLYRDIQELRTFGYEIASHKQNRTCYYYLADRPFELAELKMIIDSVQSARFLSAEKSDEIIARLESLTSQYQAGQLQRQVLISGRVKSMNDSVFETVDVIHQAIARSRQVKFRYAQWNVRKQLELRHHGAWYEESPWHLIWDNEYYYLAAYEGSSGKIKHFRVDKMSSLQILDKPREGQEVFSSLDASTYANRHFGMFGGTEGTVVLRCQNSFAGVILDRFGQETDIRPRRDGTFEASVRVVLSDQFYGWLVSVQDGVTLVRPASCVRQMRRLLEKLQEQYLPEESVHSK